MPSLPATTNRVQPLSAGSKVHHSEESPNAPVRSPGLLVANLLEPVTDPDSPISAMALAKSSFSGVLPHCRTISTGFTEVWAASPVSPSANAYDSPASVSNASRRSVLAATFVATGSSAASSVPLNTDICNGASPMSRENPGSTCQV